MGRLPADVTVRFESELGVIFRRTSRERASLYILQAPREFGISRLVGRDAREKKKKARHVRRMRARKSNVHTAYFESLGLLSFRTLLRLVASPPIPCPSSNPVYSAALRSN